MKRSDFDKMVDMGTVSYGSKKGKDSLIGKTVKIPKSCCAGDFNNNPLILTIDEIVPSYNRPMYIVGGVNSKGFYFWLTLTWEQMGDLRNDENVSYLPDPKSKD